MTEQEYTTHILCTECTMQDLESFKERIMAGKAILLPDSILPVNLDDINRAIEVYDSEEFITYRQEIAEIMAERNEKEAIKQRKLAEEYESTLKEREILLNLIREAVMDVDTFESLNIKKLRILHAVLCLECNEIDIEEMIEDMKDLDDFDAYDISEEDFRHFLDVLDERNCLIMSKGSNY